jgi:hypothetical protein
MSTQNTGLAFDINAGKNPKKSKGQRASGATKPREINVKKEYSKMTLMFGNGDNWIRPLPPIQGSEFPWVLPFEIYRLGDITGFVKTRSVKPEAKDLIYDFAAFCRGNEEFKPALYLKGAGTKAPGLRLWSQDRGICWVMLLNPDPKVKTIPLKLYHASMNNPNSGAGGSAGLMYQFYALTEEIDTDPESESTGKPLYGAIWHPEQGRKVNINVTPKANSGRNFNVRPSGKVSDFSEQIAQLNADFPEEIKMIKPLEDVISLPTDQEVLSHLKEYCEETSQKDNSTLPLDAYNAWVATLDMETIEVETTDAEPKAEEPASEPTKPEEKPTPEPEAKEEVKPEVKEEIKPEPEVKAEPEVIAEANAPETPVTSTQEELEAADESTPAKESSAKETKARITLKTFAKKKADDPSLEVPQNVYAAVDVLMENEDLSEKDNTLLNTIGKFM